MSESTFEGNVDMIQCEHTSKVDNLCISNESTNCMPGDMLPRDTNNCVDNIVSLDTLNIVPDLPSHLLNQRLPLPVKMKMMINKISRVKGCVK